MPAESPAILLIRFSSIGDLLLTTPLIRALRARHPGARISMVVREDMAETVLHNPRLSDVIAWPRDGSLRELARQLRTTPWSHRLDLHGSLRSRALRQLVGGRWSGYPKHRLRRAALIRLGRGGPLGSVAERYFAAAQGLDVTPDGGPAEFFTTREAERAADAFLAEHALGAERTLLAFAPGAAHFTKRWPADRWSALIRRVRSTADIVVVGGPGDRELADEIVRASDGAAASAAGRFSLTGTAALLKRARAVVSCDTGVMHLATAVGTPVVALFGPTVEEFGFFPYRARATVLQRELSCRPCSSHGGPVCPLGHHRCMLETLPEEVAAAVTTLPR
ncbi:MAG: glycosyltransferase family 9 protein [Gemmatimonadota bacterium]